MMNVKVPNEPIVTEAELLSRENPVVKPLNGTMLDVSAREETVIRSFVNDVEPIVPLALVTSVNVMWSACATAVSRPRAHPSAHARTDEVLKCRSSSLGSCGSNLEHVLRIRRKLAPKSTIRFRAGRFST